MNDLRAKYSLKTLLGISGLPKSTYYFETKRSDKDLEANAELIKSIRGIFAKNNENYGVRRVCAALKKKGIFVNHKKVQRLMNKLNLKGKKAKRRYHSFQGGAGIVAPNIINRDFKASRINEKWTTDVSQFNLKFGKCYLSPILDMADGRVVSFDLSVNPDFGQIQRMLDSAFSQFDDLEGLVLHSDMGWQYHNPSYIRQLKEKGIIQSMSRKGNCFDNCIIESFFGHMKNEMFYGHENEFDSFAAFKKAVIDYIRYYNEERINSKCNYMSPLEYRNRFLTQNVI